MKICTKIVFLAGLRKLDKLIFLGVASGPRFSLQSPEALHLFISLFILNTALIVIG
jgi:hypothetical protein